MNNKKAIGIFDSGIGGLTVLREVRDLLPSEDIIYLGDTARVPYGTKSAETVTKYSLQNTQFLLNKGVKAVVVACNTASAYALSTIQDKFHIPVIGVILPGASAAVAQTKNKKIAVIGTQGTIRSQAYPEAVHQLDADVQVESIPCSLLVALVEEGWFEGEVVQSILSVYLKSLKEATSQIDTLILGCTHYPLLKKAISDYLGPPIHLVDSAVETARSLKEQLTKESLISPESARGVVRFFSTDSPETMQRIGKWFLGGEISEVVQVDVSI